MSGGLFAWIASEISGAVKRNTIIVGLYGFAAFLVICAGGYALSALHTVLMLRYGTVAASLWIAGGLFLAGLLSFGIAAYLKSRPRPTRPVAQTALFAAPIAAKLLGSRMGWKGGLVAGIAVLGLVLGRQMFKDGGDADDGEA